MIRRAFHHLAKGVARKAVSATAVVLLLCDTLSRAGTPAAGEFHKTIEPILAQYCYDCHGNGEHKGNVTLDEFKSDDALLNNRDLWWRVLKNVRAGIMPPQKSDRPTDDDRLHLAQWIKYGAFGIDPSSPDPGRVTIRRLNRVEYKHTILDLMGVDFDTTGEFPPDDTGYGFDTIGDALSVSPLLLEKYMQAAQTIVPQAVPTAAKRPQEFTIDGSAFRGDDQSVHGDQLRFARAATVAATFSAHQGGNYIAHLSVQIHGDFDFDQGKCKLIFKVDGVEQWQQELAWADGKKTTVDLPEQWEPRDYAMSFELQPLPGPNGQGTNIRLQINSVRVEGPMDRKLWIPTENHQRFFPRDEAPAADPERRQYAREVLEAFTRKAFRRPAEPQTLDRLVRVAELVYQQPGKTFEQGIGQAMIATLASPRFLFRVEGSAMRQSGESYSPVDEYALASRLSYFLWSSMPDDELFDLAARGQLRKNLPSQISRMLSDPRSRALVRNFAGQWLQLRDVDGVPINARIVLNRDANLPTPDFAHLTREQRRLLGKPKVTLEPELRDALRQEPERVFAHVLLGDRSLVELIDGNYTFLNERLAKLYHIPDVYGNDMRLVSLPADSPRGGVLTMGAFLVVTSNPTRTSPVKRGQFILDNILGMPSPPPPPNVPALEESDKGLKDREPSFREVLELHRRRPLCSACHSRMDPLGLSLENFNALGMWRTMERGQPIDASGTLTTGETFHDIRDLKKIIADQHRTDFYRCVTEKMMTYALGRGLDYYDVEAVDRIVDSIQKSDGRASALVTGIIESVPFQERRNRTTPELPPTRTAALPPG